MSMSGHFHKHDPSQAPVHVFVLRSTAKAHFVRASEDDRECWIPRSHLVNPRNVVLRPDFERAFKSWQKFQAERGKTT